MAAILTDDTFKCIFLNENVWISIKISMKFVSKGTINNTPALVQIMAWLRLGIKPFSEPMVVRLPSNICVTRPQWVEWWLRNTCHQTGSFPSSRWRHNERDGVSNHQRHHFLLNRLADQRKHQSPALLAFVRGINRWPVNSPHKGPETRNMFLFDDVIMLKGQKRTAPDNS